MAEIVGMKKVFEEFDIQKAREKFQQISSRNLEIPVLQSCADSDFLSRIAQNPKNAGEPIEMFLDFLEHFDLFDQYFHLNNYNDNDNDVLFLDVDTLIGYTYWLNSVQWHLNRLQTILDTQTTNYLIDRKVKKFRRLEKIIAKDIAEISERLKERREICAIGLYMFSITRIGKFHAKEVQELREILEQVKNIID